MQALRRRVLWIFGLVAGLGLLLVALGNLGGMLVLTAISGVYAALDRRGLADDEGLVGELYAAVLTIDPPWSWVFLAGIAVLALGVFGFVAVWRAR